MERSEAAVDRPLNLDDADRGQSAARELDRWRAELRAFCATVQQQLRELAETPRAAGSPPDSLEPTSSGTANRTARSDAEPDEFLEAPAPASSEPAANRLEALNRRLAERLSAEDTPHEPDGLADSQETR